MVVQWRRRSTSPCSRDLCTIGRIFDFLCLGSFPLQGTESCPKMASRGGNSWAHVTRSQEVGWFRHSFSHQPRASFEDQSFFPSFPSALLSYYIWNLVWVQTTFSLLGLGKKFPSVLPTKIHRSHRYFPRPWKIRVRWEGYRQNLRQNTKYPTAFWPSCEIRVRTGSPEPTAGELQTCQQ